MSRSEGTWKTPQNFLLIISVIVPIAIFQLDGITEQLCGGASQL